MSDATSLEQTLRQVMFQEAEHGDQLRLLGSTPVGQSTSFPCHVLSVETSSSDRFELFLKDYSSSRLPKDGLAGRVEREVRVYRELLNGANLGTATYHGAGPAGPTRPTWLLLEFVPGVELRSCGVEARLHVAAWLGKLHAHFRSHPWKLNGADYLVNHDRDYFAGVARSALQAVREYGVDLEARLEAVLRDYDDVIDRMIDPLPTLVHGSFRPQNILLVEAESAWRVCPVDWELAGLGSPYLDLAFLVDRVQHQRDMLLDAYVQELRNCGMPVPDRRALLDVIDCFRLHKMLKSLSNSRAKNYSLRSVSKILALAEGIRGAIINHSTRGRGG